MRLISKWNLFTSNVTDSVFPTIHLQTHQESGFFHVGLFFLASENEGLCWFFQWRKVIDGTNMDLVIPH